jgi:hypothetical protein
VLPVLLGPHSVLLSSPALCVTCQEWFSRWSLGTCCAASSMLQAKLCQQHWAKHGLAAALAWRGSDITRLLMATLV